MVCGSVSPNDSHLRNERASSLGHAFTGYYSHPIGTNRHWKTGRTNRVVGHAPADTSFQLALVNVSSCNVVRRAFHALHRWKERVN